MHYKTETPMPEHRDRSGKTPPFKARSDWPEAAVKRLLSETCDYLFDYGAELSFADEPGKTRVKVRLARNEPKRVPDSELRDALSTVFHAIGANNGRRIYVEELERRKA